MRRIWPILLLLALPGHHHATASGNKTTLFTCPEQFGYYDDLNDCSKYFVCVFGEALHETCTGGLYFSAELLTCDWPRNIPCNNSEPKGGKSSTSLLTTSGFHPGEGNPLPTTTPIPPSSSSSPLSSPSFASYVPVGVSSSRAGESDDTYSSPPPLPNLNRHQPQSVSSSHLPVGEEDVPSSSLEDEDISPYDDVLSPDKPGAGSFRTKDDEETLDLQRSRSTLKQKKTQKNKSPPNSNVSVSTTFSHTEEDVTDDVSADSDSTIEGSGSAEALTSDEVEKNKSRSLDKRMGNPAAHYQLQKLQQMQHFRRSRSDTAEKRMGDFSGGLLSFDGYPSFDMVTGSNLHYTPLASNSPNVRNSFQSINHGRIPPPPLPPAPPTTPHKSHTRLTGSDEGPVFFDDERDFHPVSTSFSKPPTFPSHRQQAGSTTSTRSYIPLDENRQTSPVPKFPVLRAPSSSFGLPGPAISTPPFSNIKPSIRNERPRSYLPPIQFSDFEGASASKEESPSRPVSYIVEDRIPKNPRPQSPVELSNFREVPSRNNRPPQSQRPSAPGYVTGRHNLPPPPPPPSTYEERNRDSDEAVNHRDRGLVPPPALPPASNSRPHFFEPEISSSRENTRENTRERGSGEDVSLDRGIPTPPPSSSSSPSSPTRNDRESRRDRDRDQNRRDRDHHDRDEKREERRERTRSRQTESREREAFEARERDRIREQDRQRERDKWDSLADDGREQPVDRRPVDTRPLPQPSPPVMEYRPVDINSDDRNRPQPDNERPRNIETRPRQNIRVERIRPHEERPTLIEHERPNDRTPPAGEVDRPTGDATHHDDRPKLPLRPPVDQPRDEQPERQLNRKPVEQDFHSNSPSSPPQPPLSPPVRSRENIRVRDRNEGIRNQDRGQDRHPDHPSFREDITRDLERERIHVPPVDVNPHPNQRPNRPRRPSSTTSLAPSRPTTPSPPTSFADFSPEEETQPPRSPATSFGDIIDDARRSPSRPPPSAPIAPVVRDEPVQPQVLPPRTRTVSSGSRQGRRIRINSPPKPPIIDKEPAVEVKPVEEIEDPVDTRDFLNKKNRNQEHGVPLGIFDYNDEPAPQPVEPVEITTEKPKRNRTRPSSSGSGSSTGTTNPGRRKRKNKSQRYPANYLTLPSRPRPVRQTPIPAEIASKCDPAVCVLPDCYCGHAKIPGNLPLKQVPQIVMLTFDDAVNDLNWEIYEEIFNSGRKNPNGCPPLGTFYVSHEWTDYSQVQTLYSRGHEMASHGVTHSFGEKFSKAQWLKEIDGQREVLHLYGGVALEDIRGMRAPFLQIGGNKMFEMLFEANFTYDSSMPVFDNNPPFYPYTLDYALNHECMITPCPTKSYPGLWEVGMIMWEDLRGGRCSMGDACTNPSDAESVYKMLIKNFNRHYTSNRAPFGLFYHSAWFNTEHHRKGYLRFMDEILTKDDVYFITNWQMIQWMRNPVPVSQIKSFTPWSCDPQELRRTRPDACTNPSVCNARHPTQGTRFIRTCGTCPTTYPWVGNNGL